MTESSQPLGPQLYVSGGGKHIRRIVAEDPDWTLAKVPYLSKLCLESVMKNIEVKPTYKELSPSDKNYVQEKLPLSVPLTVTANLISDGVYWQRRCKQLWDICDVSNYGKSWKRMFFERYMEGLIELFIPGVTGPKSVLEMVPLCKNYVKRLQITQLLPPIKQPQKEDGEDWLDLSSNQGDRRPSLDHFNFNILLEKLTCLEELHLAYRLKQCGMNFEWKMFQMTKQDCNTLAVALKSCKTLKVLWLRQSLVDDDQCRLLVKDLLDHPSLTELNFSYNSIGDRGARAIGKLLDRSKLQTLDLLCNTISDHGAKAIAHALSTNSTLLSLNLQLNSVSDEGGQAIAQALLENSTLQHLHLGANKLTAQTAISLSEVLVHNNTLKSINLVCNKLGAEGGKALKEAMSKNSSLTECDLRRTDVDDKDHDFINQVVWSNQEQAQQRTAK